MPKASTSASASPGGWLVVACASHIARGVAGGFVQVNHGKRPALDRMRVGDVVVCYSPNYDQDDARGKSKAQSSSKSKSKSKSAKANAVCKAAAQGASKSESDPEVNGNGNDNDNGEGTVADVPALSRATFEKSFTAIGVVSDQEPFQAELDGTSWQPWRRKVDWYDAEHVTLESVKPQLHLCQGKSWGFKVMKGFTELDGADVDLLRRELGAAKGAKTEGAGVVKGE